MKNWCAPSGLAGAAVVVIAVTLAVSRLVARHQHRRSAARCRWPGISRTDEEFRIPLPELIEHGRQLFAANWTDQEGGGRPLTKGTGKALTDPSRPLTGARAFNRISAPDANSCAGCHNAPYGMLGGGGDFVTNVFVLAQRFDFVTFDPATRCRRAARWTKPGRPSVCRPSATRARPPGMFGAGYLEMLARQMTDGAAARFATACRSATRERWSRKASRSGSLTRGAGRHVGHSARWRAWAV